MNKGEKIKTRFSFREFESHISFDWNSNEDRASKSHPTDACFPPGFLKRNGERVFNAAKNIIQGTTQNYESVEQLERSMKLFGCNKGTAHNYTKVYGLIFEQVVDEVQGFFEIGVGSNFQDGQSRMHEEYTPGASLRAWKHFFSSAHIAGADIDPRVLFRESRIDTYYLDSLNPRTTFETAISVGQTLSAVDVILDDGLHTWASNLSLLLTLFPVLSNHGLYIIEDMSEESYIKLLGIIGELNLGAWVVGIELEHEFKSDNRLIVLQKQ